MTIKQLCEEEARKLGMPEDKIFNAGVFADSTSQGKDLGYLKEDMPEVLIEPLREYIHGLITGRNDPVISKMLEKAVYESVERN